MQKYYIIKRQNNIEVVNKYKYDYYRKLQVELRVHLIVKICKIHAINLEEAWKKKDEYIAAYNLLQVA